MIWFPVREQGTDAPALPVEQELPPSPKFRLHKFIGFLKRFWWIPTITLTISLGGAGFYFLHQPPTFVSRGSLWDTVKMQLPGKHVQRGRGQFSGTQSDLLQSGLLRARVLNTLRSGSATAKFFQDADDEGPPVKIRVVQASRSAVFMLEATGPQPEYLQAYLEALMEAYLGYKGEIRKEVSGGTRHPSWRRSPSRNPN